MNQMKLKIMNQMNFIMDKNAKEESALQSLTNKKSDYRKQILLNENTPKNSYNFEGVSENKVKVIESGKNQDNNKQNYENNENYQNFNNSNNIVNMLTPNEKATFEIVMKKESSLDSLGLEASVRPRRGDYTPKSNETEDKVEEELIQNSPDVPNIKNVANGTNGTNENNGIHTNNENNTYNTNKISYSSISNANLIEVTKKLQEKLKNEGKDYISNTLYTEQSNNIHDPILKPTVKTQNTKNMNNVSKIPQNTNNMNMVSNNPQNTKNINNINNVKNNFNNVKNSNNIDKNVKTTTNATNNKANNPYPYNTTNLLKKSKTVQNLTKEKKPLTFPHQVLMTEYSSPKHNLNIKSPHTNTQANETHSNTHTTFNANKPTTTTNRDYSKFDVEKIGYDLNRQYSKTKISKNEKFIQRMMFDVFKRHTKEERLSKLLEKNKAKMSEFDRVNAFNRLIEDANRRLEAQEKLETLKNDLNTISETQENTLKKTVSEEEWENVYNQRFITYKNVKEAELEKKIILKEKQLKEEEDKIIEEINNKTKKAPQKTVEDIVSRMYNEADKRKIMSDQKKREREYLVEKQEQDGMQSAQRKKKEIDYKVKSDLSKPTSTFLAKVSKVKNLKNITGVNIVRNAKSANSKSKERSNLLEKNHLFMPTDLDEYLTKVLNTEEERQIGSIPTEFISGLASSRSGRPPYRLAINSNAAANRIKFNNEFKSDKDKLKLNSKRNLHAKKLKYLPDFMANNLVGNILNDKLYR